MSMIQKLSFGFLGGGSSETGILEDILPFPMAMDPFVKSDVEALYSRILTDTLERTDGIPEKRNKVLWDNCLKSEANEGLVTMLAKAMASKTDLFLVMDGDVLRKADDVERQKIEDDYKKNAESTTGIYVSFKNFSKNDMVKLYSAIEFFTIGGLYKSAGISKAIQIKIKDLRSSVARLDAPVAEAQARGIAKALKQGKDVMIDGEDTIETAKPDLTATKETIDFVNKKKSLYLGLPASYLEGTSQAGLGDSGKGDSKKTESGLKNYYFSIIKPVVEDLFRIKTTFKTEDFEMIGVANDTLTTFEATTDEHISKENKTTILNKLYGLPEDAVGDEPEEPVANPPPGQNQPPPGNPPVNAGA